MSIFGRFVFVTSAILTCVIFAQSAYASLCMPTDTSDDFFGSVYHRNQVDRENEGNTTLIVVMAEVKEYMPPEQTRFGSFPQEMILTVSAVIQGEVNQSELLVRGSNGMSAQPYITEFPVGESFIFALGKARSGNYYIPQCRKYFQGISLP